jgi:hypothetical protein
MRTHTIIIIITYKRQLLQARKCSRDPTRALQQQPLMSELLRWKFSSSELIFARFLLLS